MTRKPSLNPVGAPIGNRNAALPDDQKRVSVHVYLAPRTIELLEPFTRKSQRGATIDKAVAEYIERYHHEH